MSPGTGVASSRMSLGLPRITVGIESRTAGPVPPFGLRRILTIPSVTPRRKTSPADEDEANAIFDAYNAVVEIYTIDKVMTLTGVGRNNGSVVNSIGSTRVPTQHPSKKQHGLCTTEWVIA